MKLKLTDLERRNLRDRYALAEDRNGNEVLAGLTVEESIFFMEHRRKFLAGDRDRDNRARSIDLNQKHEDARLQILGAATEKKNLSPTQH